VNQFDYAPLVFEKSLIGLLILVIVAPLALRSTELLQRRYRLSKGKGLALLYFMYCAYLALPVAMRIPERFAPAITPFLHVFGFLGLMATSILGAVALYVVLGGKLPRNQERRP
jgi:hypothetical protein